MSETPSLLFAWLFALRENAAAINRAVEDYAAHCRHMPSPQSAGDVRDLLDFRRKQFHLGDEPAGEGERLRAAEMFADTLIGDARRKVSQGGLKFLEGVEMELSFAAQRNLHGLFSFDGIAAAYLVVSQGGQIMLTSRRALPANHPLHAINERTYPGWLALGPASKSYNPFTGAESTALPPWCTVASVCRQAEEERAELEARTRREAEARRWTAEETARLQRIAMSPEQRDAEFLEERLRRLEKQLPPAGA